MNLRDKLKFWMALSNYVDMIVRGTSPLSLPDAIANSLSYVKAFGGTEQGLPDGYTRLEYIQSTGTQYIDTGILLSNTDVFEITFQSLGALQTPVMGAISGGASYTATNNLSITYNITVTLSAYSVYCDGAAGDSYHSWNGGNRNDGLKHTIKYNGLNIAPTIDGVAMTQLMPTTLVAITPTVTTWLFGRNNTSTGTLSQRGVRIYDFHIQGKGHFIPAKRNSDNVLGMYDTVSGQFFTNAGTDEFVAGPQIVPTPDAPMDIVSNNGVLKVRRQSGLPLGYQIVEWLKSSGSIVITGFKTKSTQEIETVFYRERSGASYLYSSDTATSGTTNTTAYLTSGAGNWRWDGKSYSISVPTGIEVTSIQKNDGVWLNGTKTGWYSDAGDFVSTNDLRLSSGENTTVRIYSQTIREGDTVTLDLVPVQRLSDSSYGFYDKVSGEFYTNAEATFVAGDVIADPVEIYTDGTVETIEDTIGNTATTEMLLKVGDYQDEQEILSGAITRNVGVKVLTGAADEQWGTSVSTKFYWDTDFAKALNYSPTLCTHYQAVLTDRTSGVGNNQIALFVNFAKGRIVICDPRFTTVSDFKAFLANQYAAGTPVTIVYPLATPTTESVAGQTLQVTGGDNVLEITQASLNNLELEAKYQAEQ